MAPNAKAIRGGSLLFITQSPDSSGTDLVNPQKMKDWVNLGASQCFSKNVFQS